VPNQPVSDGRINVRAERPVRGRRWPRLDRGDARGATGASTGSAARLLAGAATCARRARRLDPHTPEGGPDFVFSQMDSGRPFTSDDWIPQFLDYLALGVTTATAFSAADTVPISP
jgi:hypothetical protein